MYCNLDLYIPFQIKLSEAKKATSFNNQLFIILDEKKINQKQMKKYLKETKKKLHKINYKDNL